MYPHWQKLWDKPLVGTRKYQQISERIIALINDGVFIENDRLPPLYLLARKLQTTATTVKNAYKKLSNDFIIVIKPGVGSFVAGYLPMTIEKRPLIEIDTNSWQFKIEKSKPKRVTPFLVLGTEIPNLRQLPLVRYLNFFSSVVESIEKSSDAEVVFKNEIRSTFHQVLANRGINVHQNEFKVINGGAALGFVIKTLISSGDNVVMDSPDDIQAYNIFNERDANIFFCGSKGGKFNITKLKRLCSKTKMKLVFLRPSASIPGLHYLKEEERDQLVELSLKYKFLIISMDNNYGWWHKQPLKPLFLREHKGTVIYMGPISKVFSLTNQMEFVAGPSDFLDLLEQNVLKAGNKTDLSIELAISRVINLGWLTEESEKLLRIYKHRQNRIVKLFEAYLAQYSEITIPISGLFLYLSFKKETDISPVLSKLSDLSVFSPFNNFHLNYFKPITSIRLGYASLAPAQWEKVFKVLSDHLKASNLE